MADLTCLTCNKVFPKPSQFRSHIQGDCKIAPNKKNEDAGLGLSHKHALQKQQAKLDAIDANQVDPRTPKQSIIINLFGQEVFDHITSADVRRILDEVLQDHGTTLAAAPAAAQSAVLRMATLLYSDPNHLENVTCYLSDENDIDALVHGVNGWEAYPADMVLSLMSRASAIQLCAKRPRGIAYQYDQVVVELQDRAALCNGRSLS